MAKTLLSQRNEHHAIAVIVDWSGGSNPPYVQAAINIRLVGAMTAYLIRYMYVREIAVKVNFTYLFSKIVLYYAQKVHNLSNLDNVHLIGHSLGAHLMGYCGSHLQRNFGLKPKRISGLDPAAPLFSDTDPIVRLDTSDAEFVDVIHTDINLFMKGGLGIDHPIGHVDFYPNGGFNNPGCDMQLTEYIKNTKNTILSNMQEFLSCNHLRSHQYFTESILGNCRFLGITCSSYEQFKAVHCFHCDANDNLCIPMGYHSFKRYTELKRSQKINDAKPLMLYLTTGNRMPFCRVHYKITVRVAGHDESNMHGGEVGTLSVRLHGKDSHKRTDRVNFSEEPMFFEPGYEYTALVPGDDIKKPSHATAYWEYETNFLNPLTWRLLTSPRIFLDYILIESLESENLYLKLCSLNNLPIISNSATVFKAHYCT